MKLFQIEKIAIIKILKMRNSYRNRIHKNSEFREFPLINIFNVFNPRHKEAKIQLFVGNYQEITNPEYTYPKTAHYAHPCQSFSPRKVYQMWRDSRYVHTHIQQ